MRPIATPFRVWRAFLLAPLAAPVGYWIDLLLEAAVDPSRQPFVFRGGLYALSISILIGGPIAYAVAALTGIPLWLATRERGASIWTAAGVGLIAGIVTALVLAPSLRAELFSIPLGVWRGGGLGVLTAVVWWQLLYRKA